MKNTLIFIAGILIGIVLMFNVFVYITLSNRIKGIEAFLNNLIQQGQRQQLSTPIPPLTK